MKKILLLNSHLPPAYSIVRQFCKSNYKVYTTKERKNCNNFVTSKFEKLIGLINQPRNDWVSGYILCDPTTEQIEYFLEILKICEGSQIKIVWPVNDIDIYNLSRFKKKFRDRGILLCCPDFDVFICNADKYDSIQKAASFKISVPNTYLFNPDEDNFYNSLLNKAPLIIKARLSESSSYVWKVNTYEEFSNVIRRLTFLGRQPVIQEFIVGDKEFSYHFLTNKSGEIIFGFSMEKFRHLQESWSTAIKIIKNDNFYHSLLPFVKSHKQAGFWVIQGKKCELSGKIKFIEANCRFGNNSRIIFEMTKCNFPLILLNFYISDNVSSLNIFFHKKTGVAPIDDSLAIKKNLSNIYHKKNKIKFVRQVISFYLTFPSFDIYFKSILIDYKYCSAYFKQLKGLIRKI